MNKRHNLMRVGTSLTEKGVLQTRDICGEVSHQFVTVCAKQMDDKLRERLLELGWLPPEDVQKLRDAGVLEMVELDVQRAETPE